MIVVKMIGQKIFYRKMYFLNGSKHRKLEICDRKQELKTQLFYYSERNTRFRAIQFQEIIIIDHI